MTVMIPKTRAWPAQAMRALKQAVATGVILGYAASAGMANAATRYEYEGRLFDTPAQACAAVAKARRDDKSVDNPYGKVAAARDADNGFWCKLVDKDKNENEQTYGNKVLTQDGAAKMQAQAGKEDCADLEALAAEPLKREVTTRVRRHLEAANAELTNNPAVAMDVLHDNEVNYIFGGKGYRKNGQTLQMNDSAFNILYGHAVERLTARNVDGDACLSRFVEHVSAEDQRQEGANPDFIGLGKAKGLEIDITTSESAQRKRKIPAKAHYAFVTYERHLVIGNNGVAVAK